MKIGIHGTLLAQGFPSGLKSYAVNLLTALSAVDKKNSYYIFVPKGTRIPLGRNFHFVDIPKVPIFKRQIVLPFLTKKYNLDVFHFLEPYVSIFLKHPRIVTTVPDIDLEGGYPLASRHFFYRIYCELIRYFVFRNSKAFITISNTIKKELKAYLGSQSTKTINTIYLAADSTYKVTKKNIDSQKYLLAMGDFAERKNSSGVINAYELLSKKIKQECSLKVVVSSSKYVNKFVRLAQIAGIESQMETLVSISKKELRNYYINAQAFIYPSLYEGFGLPILEAMASGCPVITSDYGAMKEVADGAAALVNPKSIRSIRNGILKVVNDAKLRSLLTAKGLKRSKEFSWRKTAQETLKVYTHLYLSSLDN